MNDSKVTDAVIRWKDGQSLSILNPSLHEKDGYQVLRGFLDRNEVTNESAQSRLGLDERRTSGLVSELPTIEATGYGGMSIWVYNVQCTKWIGFTNEVEFLCHTHVISTLGIAGNSSEPDRVKSITIEGLKLQYRGQTKRTEKRHLFDKSSERLVSSRLDFRETILPLHPQKVEQQLRVAFIEAESNEGVTLAFDRPSQPSIHSYASFRNKLCSFLSFAVGNDLVIRNEVYWEGGQYLLKTYSTKKAQRKVKSEFIPLAYDQFRAHRILESYLNSFPTFLHLERDLGLSEVIFLVNQSKRVSIESGFFILAVAVEKLADRFLHSKWGVGPSRPIMDSDQFRQYMEPVTAVFDVAFDTLKGTDRTSFNQLRSRLNNINLKGRTDSKIDALLDYAEVNKTGNAQRLFPMLRNHALHEGNIDVPPGAAWDNYQALVLLVNECIANLIQYKGTRLLERRPTHNLIDEKTVFVPTYSY